MHPLDFMVPIASYSASVRSQPLVPKAAEPAVFDVGASPAADIGFGVAFSQRPSSAEESTAVENKVLSSFDDF
jgi:hypothetical protein